MHVPVLHGVLEAMHAALGETRLLGKASHALSAVITKALANLKTFVPQAHIGLFSAG
jgi:hypothetical protein